jgi:hypothetical protein
MRMVRHDAGQFLQSGDGIPDEVSVMTRSEVWTALTFMCLATAVALGTTEWMSRESAKLNAAAYEQGNQDAKILGEIREHIPARPLMVTMTVRVRHSRTWRSYVVRATTDARWFEVRGEALARLVEQIKAERIGNEEISIEMGENHAKKTAARHHSPRGKKLGGRAGSRKR